MSLHHTSAWRTKMAIQVTHLPADNAAARITVHLRDFWEPRMVRALLAHIDSGGADLDPVAARAVEQLRQPA